jgi:single-strand DNA-binding protein
VSSGLNRVLLLGDLAAAPELSVTRSGRPVLTLRLATPEPYLDEDGVRRERRSFHHVVVVGRRADALAKTLHRGARIFIEGSLRTTSHEGQGGKKRLKTEVVAAEVFLAGEVAPSPALPSPTAPARSPAPASRSAERT